MSASVTEQTTSQIIVIHREDSFQFLDDISTRAIALFTNACFIKNVGAKMCARMFGEDQMITEEIEEFTKNAMLNLRIRLKLHGLLFLDSCMESHIECDSREMHVHGEIEKLYFQEYDLKTLKSINYDVNIEYLWTLFDSSENISTLRDLSIFHLSKIGVSLSPRKYSTPQSPRKKFAIPSEEASPTKIRRQILPSPSAGGLFGSDNDEEEDSEDEVKDQLVHPLLPTGMK